MVAASITNHGANEATSGAGGLTSGVPPLAELVGWYL